MTNASVPAGLEIKVDGGHYWSVDGGSFEGEFYKLHTYCGPEPFPGPGCNVKGKDNRALQGLRARQIGLSRRYQLAFTCGLWLGMFSRPDNRAFLVETRAAAHCDKALILSAYSSFSSDHIDWRLAATVTQEEYEQIKHDAGEKPILTG